MKLKKLLIERQLWGDAIGKLKGEVTLEQSAGITTLILTDEQLAGILQLVAPAVIESAKELAGIIVQEVLEIQQPLTEIEHTGDSENANG